MHSGVRTDRPTRYAIIPTYNRPAELVRLVGQLEEWADYVVILDNGSVPPVSQDALWALHPKTMPLVIERRAKPPQLYRMWNVAFEAITARELRQERADGGPRTWDVAVFNDDTDLPPGWLEQVNAGLRGPEAPAAACTWAGGHVLHKRSPDGYIGSRMCPWAFMVRGELGLRADERFGWWWGDTDFDWRLRQSGGVPLLPGAVPGNTLANSTTVGVLAEQAGRDGQAFAAKWGRRPW